MDKRIFLATVTACSMLAGCNIINQFMRPGEETMEEPVPTANEQEQSPTSKPKAEPTSEQKVQEQKIKQEFGEEGGQYKDYETGDVPNGKDAILFFHASWCPDCQRNDNNLKDWYKANYIPLSVYKIDYDSAIGLKQKYGVVQQDTFVRIDGEGNKVASTSFPTEVELLKMLRP